MHRTADLRMNHPQTNGRALSMQVKLLRVLEDRRVMRVGGRIACSIDVRFISATNRDIEAASAQGGFRRDLYFRLNGISLNVPPLRERRADLAPLARAFASAAGRASGLSCAPDLALGAIAVLERYDWPGNIRQLRNVIERAVLLCDGARIEPAHLPAKLTASSLAAPTSDPSAVFDPRALLLSEIERLDRERIVEALARCGGNQTHAAEILGMSRRTLVTRLQDYDLPRPRKRASET